MSSAKKIFGGLMWSICVNLATAVYNFISIPILLMHYGRQEYGLISVALSVNVYLKLMDLGFSSGNIRFFSDWLSRKEYDKLNKLFQSSIVFYGIIGIINALILFVVSSNAAAIFSLTVQQADILKNMFEVLMVSAFISWVSSVFDQFLRASEMVGWQQRLLLIPKMLQFAIIYITIKWNLSIQMFFFLSTFIILFRIPFAAYKIKKKNPWISFAPIYHNSVFKLVLPYCLSLFSFGIFQFSAIYLRPVILGIRGAGRISDVADYRILEGFASLIMMIASDFIGVILPSATKAKALGDKEKEFAIAFDGTKYITIFLAFVIFGFMLVSSNLLTLYVGKSYAQLDIWLNIWILTLLAMHNSALSSLVLSETKLRPIVIMSAISTFSSLGLAWLISPLYGVGGVVIGYLFYNIFQISFYYLYYYPRVMKLNSKKLFGFSFFIPCLVIGACSFGSSFIIQNISLKKKLLEVLVDGAVYAVITIPIIYFALLNENDKLFFKKLLRIPSSSNKMPILENNAVKVE